MMETNNLKLATAYFLWLRNLVHMNKYDHKCYSGLSRVLHNRKFTYFVPNDDNRAGDGEFLRIKFAQDMSYEEEEIQKELEGPCTVLEMLIGLAIRLDFQTSAAGSTNTHVTSWFWELIYNLGLDKYDNGSYPSILDKKDEDKINDILTIFMDRKYKPDGSNGGLFPVKNPIKNQKNVEIWYQMAEYLSQKNN